MGRLSFTILCDDVYQAYSVVQKKKTRILNRAECLTFEAFACLEVDRGRFAALLEVVLDRLKLLKTLRDLSILKPISVCRKNLAPSSSAYLSLFQKQ